MDEWVPERTTDHSHFIKVVGNDVLRTHASFGNKGMSEGRWQYILRTQLKTTDAEFWNALATGTPIKRPSPVEPKPPRSIPAWAARMLSHDMHLTTAAIQQLTPHEAVEMANQFWSRPPSAEDR